MHETLKRRKEKVLNQAVDVLSRKFSQEKLHPSQKSIGLEIELPVVNWDGLAIGRTTVEKVFQEFTQNGWEPIIDPGTERLVAVTKNVHGYLTTFGTDVGHSIVEVACPPARDLHQASTFRSELLAPIIRSFQKHDGKVLSYGILPRNKPHINNMAAKGRYAHFAADSGNTFVKDEDQAGSVDLHVFALTAASQTHTLADKEGAIKEMNILNSLAGPFMLLGANSPVWQGRVDKQGIKAVREWLWRVGWPNRQAQTGMLKPMADFKDYINNVLSFAPQMIKRNGEFLSLKNSARTLMDLLVSGDATARRVNGESVQVEINPDDILFWLGFLWTNARATSYGTVESRIACQQPPESPLAMSALSHGLLSNSERASMLVNSRSMKYWNQFYEKGLNGGFNFSGAIDICEEMIRIAEEGLKLRNYNEEIFLQPLKERLEKRMSPADEIKAIFTQRGIQGLIEKTEITLDSLVN